MTTARHDPSFLMYQVNGNRTGWQPVLVPVILSVPHRDLPDSDVHTVRIYVEDAPTSAIVAGHDHVGLRVPDRDLYSVTVSRNDLAEREIDLTVLSITRNGVPVALEDAQVGDLVAHRCRTGTLGSFPWLPAARYYDLSDIAIQVETLPSGRYVLVHQATFARRVINADNPDELLCIDADDEASAIRRFPFNHPGEIHEDFCRQMPAVYFTEARRSQDPNVAFLRPFTDLFQDVMDEQDLLRTISWADRAPAAAIPYLGSLLGWELPYYPSSLDGLRRAVLRQTVGLQNLKGSQRAVTEIFRLFGYEIQVKHLWWAEDGTLIRQDVRPAGLINTVGRCQVDLLLNGREATGFDLVTVPLLAIPQAQITDDYLPFQAGGDVTLEAWRVTIDSDADVTLAAVAAALAADPTQTALDVDCVTDTEGFVASRWLNEQADAIDHRGYSRLLISGKLGQVASQLTLGAAPPYLAAGCRLDRTNNELQLILDGPADPTERVYAFALYQSTRVVVPAELADRRSNRFEIRVASAGGVMIDSTTLEFVIEFLYLLKALHSQLHLVDYRVDIGESYLAGGLCVGGDVEQRHDVDLGRQQVPPAIMPLSPVDQPCPRVSPSDLGYKPSDLAYRNRLMTGLLAEWKAWQAMDGVLSTPSTGLWLPPMRPLRDACAYNPYGQDRTKTPATEAERDLESPTRGANQHGRGTASRRLLVPSPRAAGVTPSAADLSANSDLQVVGAFTGQERTPGEALCTPDGSDYCYVNRVADELLTQFALAPSERWRMAGCGLRLGSGVHWTYPAISRAVRPGVGSPARRSRTAKTVWTGASSGPGVRGHRSPPQTAARASGGWLGDLYRAYGDPTSATIHQTNRNPISWSQQSQLALKPAVTDVELPTLHFPGCRFLGLGGLEEDYVSSEWRAKPWDDAQGRWCGAKIGCATPPTQLNATLVDNYLVYDDEPYTALGNGKLPDIESLGSHPEDDRAIHTIVAAVSDGHPSVTLDGMVSTGTGTVVDVAEQIFGSAVVCGTGWRDLADGHPASRGEQAAPAADLDRSGVWAEIIAALEIPTGQPATASYFLGDGLLVGRGARLDCGCWEIECDTTAAVFVPCGGAPTWESDASEIELVLVADETLGVRDLRLNGTIPSLLETE